MIRARTVHTEAITSTRFEWVMQFRESLKIHRDMNTPETELEQVMVSDTGGSCGVFRACEYVDVDVDVDVRGS